MLPSPCLITEKGDEPTQTLICVGEGNLDQLFAEAVLDNLLNIKEEEGKGREGRKYKKEIYCVGLIGNPVEVSGPTVIVCNLLKVVCGLRRAKKQPITHLLAMGGPDSALFEDSRK